MISKGQLCDFSQIAHLHHKTINQGFMPKLGISFLKSLYRFLIKKELVLVHKENDKVLGFVSCALSSKGIMKRFLVSSPAGILKVVLALLKNPALLKQLWETFRAPALTHDNSEHNIPVTELLSICVSPKAQQGGIGAKLIKALEEELKNRGITQYKVIAGQKLVGANKFYRKNGFQLATQITIHGNDISNVYVKNIL